MADRLFLLDTQIWMDHYLRRGLEGTYGTSALQLILTIIADGSTIIISNFQEKELKAVGLAPTEIISLFSMLKPDHITRVSVTKTQFAEAHRVAKQREVPLGDAIHAIVARDFNAQLVSRDEKDFRKLKDITQFKEPQDFL